MRALNSLALILVIIGALNWLLIGLFGFDLVASVFASAFSRIIYLLVGISGFWLLFTLLPRVVSGETYEYGRVEAT